MLGDEAAQQRKQSLDGLLVMFFILNEYNENCFNANVDCSAHLTFKDKAQKPEGTTHLKS